MKILDVTNNVAKQTGEVGIEIEVEGRHLPEHVVGWRREHDGSLRGESCEYVLKVPCKRAKVTDYLGRMEIAYREEGTKVQESERQSIHIHVNVQDMNFAEVYNFITLFLIFEHSLVSFCGEHRQGNLFCLRSEDAEGLFSKLEECASPDNIYGLNTDDIRYSAINAASLFKYGSLEFRSMRGTADFGLIKKWIDVLLTIKDAALTYETPVEILTELSMVGVDKFITKIFGEHEDVIKEQNDWKTSLFANMRAIQVLVYSGDWEGLRADHKKPVEEDGMRVKKPGLRGGGFHAGELHMERPRRPEDIIKDIRRRQDAQRREVQMEHLEREARRHMGREEPADLAPPPVPGEVRPVVAEDDMVNVRRNGGFVIPPAFFAKKVEVEEEVDDDDEDDFEGEWQ